MADTNFNTGVVISSGWLNDVNDHVYREVYNVLHYGADPTGVSDCTAAFQAAIDAAEAKVNSTEQWLAGGAVVYVPMGNYRFTNTAGLNIQSSGVVIKGEPGRTSRLLVEFANEATPRTFITIGNGTDQMYCQGLEDLYIAIQDGGGRLENTNITAVFVQRSFFGRMNNCIFRGFWKSVVTAQMNRWNITNCVFQQQRGTNIAHSSIQFVGSASGNGGGNHVTDCEFAAEGGSLTPCITSHIHVNEQDSCYINNCHFRDASYSVYLNPLGTDANQKITTHLFTQCYFDVNWNTSVFMEGTLRAGNLMQQIEFHNCLFREGAPGNGTYCMRVSLASSGTNPFDGEVNNIKVVGGTMRQANSEAVLIEGAALSKIEIKDVLFLGVMFENNNQSNTATASAIRAECDNITIANCIFAPDDVACAEVVRIVQSTTSNSQAKIVMVNNDFSRTNCTSTIPWNFTVPGDVARVIVSGNLLNGQGRSILNQPIPFQTNTASITDAWTWVMQQGQMGNFLAQVAGSSNDGGVAISRTFAVSARRNASTTTMATVTEVHGWNPDTLPTVPTFALSTNTVALQVRGPTLTTAGSFVVGRRYRISTVGTTNYTLIGAASNTVGVEFVATGAGTGTGTAATVMYWNINLNAIFTE